MNYYGLSNAEHEVMKLFWSTTEPQILNDVLAYMESQGTIWKQQTAHTVLRKLTEKGALQSEKRGFRRYYSARLSEKEYISRWTNELIRDKYNNSLTSFLLAFTDGKPLSAEQAKELEQFLHK